jgi:hypothetical protein
MPNAVKYKTGNLTGSLQKGNVALGISGSLGPTSTTGWYNGPNPVAGKYQIFETAASGDPDVYSPQDDAELIRFARWKGATGADTGSAAAVLAWIGTQTNLMAANFEYPTIVTDGLVLNLDAGFVGSYPTINTTWYDISGNANNGTLTNGPTFNSANSGSLVFDGVDDKITGTSFVADITNKTLQGWVKLSSISQQGGGLINLQGVSGQPSPYTGVDGEPFDSIVYNETNQGWGFGSTNFNRTAWSGVKETSTNDWVFICATYANNNYNLYRNGSLILNTTSFLAYNYNFTCRVQIGERHTGGGSGFLSANIAAGALYNRALTAAEVLQNYNAQKGRFGL